MEWPWRRLKLPTILTRGLKKRKKLFILENIFSTSGDTEELRKGFTERDNIISK